MRNRSTSAKEATSSLWPYVAFLGFCLLSAIRDVLSELFFKNVAYKASPVFVLFVYSVSTQAIALVLIGWYRIRGKSSSLEVNLQTLKEVVLMNAFTLGAYLTFFLAISTSLGAAFNSLIDYGSGPIFTAVVGSIVLGETLNSRFFLALASGVCGIGIFSVGRMSTSMDPLFFIGVTLALISSFCSAIYRVVYKLLLNKGMKKEDIVFWRLFGLTVCLGVYLGKNPPLFRVDLLPQIMLLGLVGFTLPLFLVLFVIQQLQLRSFALLLFLMPVLTYMLSAMLGYTNLKVSDIVAACVILAGVALHEYHTQVRSAQSLGRR